MDRPAISLNQILSKIEQLPQLPEVLYRVTQMMEDPDIDAQALADVIRLDENLTIQMLRLCNSAAYGLKRKILSVREAVAILGFKTIRSMVYTILSKTALDKRIPGYQLDQGMLWRNALTGAVYAKHLAEHYHLLEPEQAFTAAILRDIGKTILGEFVGANYEEIERLHQQDNLDFLTIEERVLGVNHCFIGGKVSEKWMLPEPITKTILHHHQPSKMSQTKLARNLGSLQKGPQTGPQTVDVFSLVTTVHLADAYTMMVGPGIGIDGLMYALDYEALEVLGIKMDRNTLERDLSRLTTLNQVVNELIRSFG